MASFRHFAWRFFVISSFCVASFRYFVFSRGVFSLFRVALFRYFVFSRGVISLFRYFAWRNFVAKRRKDEMAQISHHTMGIFFRRSRAGNSTVRDLISPNVELIRDFMVALVTCKTEEDPIKNEGARVATNLYVDFSDV